MNIICLLISKYFIELNVYKGWRHLTIITYDEMGHFVCDKRYVDMDIN